MAKKVESKKEVNVVCENGKPEIVYLKDSVEIIPVKHLGRHVELCARNAYKSEEKITETSWEGMVRGLSKNGHNSCFEHAPVYLEVNPKLVDITDELKLKILKGSKYVRIRTHGDKYRIYTNARVVLEEVPAWIPSLLDGTFKRPGVSIFTPQESDPDRRVSIRITTSRAIMDEILRHRVFSPTGESTRYVDYLGKFTVSLWDAHDTTSEQDNAIKAAFEDCKKHYDKLKELGAHKDVCRLVLALGIKSELIFTGFVDDFLGNFYELRSAKQADKTIQRIAEEIKALIM